MNRRRFLHVVGLASAAPFLACTSAAAESSEGVHWQIGCFNRPWAKWTFDDALDGIKTAGFPTVGLLTRTKANPFVGADATADYLAALKQKIAARGLKPNMAALRSRHDIAMEDSVREVRKQIDNAHTLNVPTLLSFGVDKPEQFDQYYKVMKDAAAYAQERGIHLVLKPHGGGSGAAEEIVRCIEKVGHPNFKIWYDAGNIIYYTGKDPVAELEPIVKYVTGFCAKDCAQPKAEVMSQFGTGKVDFKAVFAKLKAAGFNGPVMIEGVKVGATPEETTENARANREFLERVFRMI